MGSVVFSKPSSLVPLEDQPLPPVISLSASIWVAGLPVALWGIISGASRFISSVHILGSLQNFQLTFVLFLGCEDCLLGD